jgi:hypothetical protein
MTDYATDLQGRFSKFLNDALDRWTAAAKELEARKYSAEKWTGDSFWFWNEAMNVWLYPWQLVRGLEPTLQMFIEQGQTQAAGKTYIGDIGAAAPVVGTLLDVNGNAVGATPTAKVEKGPTGSELVVKLKDLEFPVGSKVAPPAGTYLATVKQKGDVIAKIRLDVLKK